MIVDLNFNGKYVVVVGGGSESYRKILSFVEAGSKILVVSKTFSSGIKKLRQINKINLLKAEVKDDEAFIKSLNPKPDLLLAVTNNHRLNVQLVKHAKLAGCTVYAVDNPSISDFKLPALARVGDVRIAVSTAGKSPAMAKELRQRIEKLITQEDLLQIKLQTHVRAILKQRISDQKVRRRVLYKVLKNDKINMLLKEGKFDEAQEMAIKILENSSAKDTNKKDTATVNQLQEA